MLTELVEVLARAGYEPPAGKQLRDVAIIMNNFFGVPPNPALPIGQLRSGFALMLLDARGEPTHYARIQAAEDEAFSAECRLVRLLSGDAVTGDIVPRSKSAHGKRIRLQVSQFLASEERLVPRPGWTPSHWLALAHDALQTRDTLCHRAAEIVPEIQSHGAWLRLDNAVQAPLSVIASVHGTGVRTNLISDVLRTLPPVPAVVQHGDFWAGNLLLHGGKWRIIDFEDFGHIYAPLYDTLHLIQTSARGGRWGPTAGWLDVGPLPVDREWRRIWGELLRTRAEALDLTPPQLGGLILFYLVRLTAHRLRPGVSEEFSVMPMSDLRAAVRHLESGGELEDLIPSGGDALRAS